MFGTLFPLTPESLGRIQHQASRTVFWEMAPTDAAVVAATGDVVFEKEAWLTTTLLNYGTCGFSIGHREEHARHSQRAVATVLFCGREQAPGVSNLPTAPVSPDADVLTSLFLDPGFAGTGLEPVLLDAAIMAVVGREAPAVEAFGRRLDLSAEQLAATGPDVRVICENAGNIGLLDVPTLESAGFRGVADHPVLPRLRLDLPPQQDLLSVEAIDQLLAESSLV